MPMPWRDGTGVTAEVARAMSIPPARAVDLSVSRTQLDGGEELVRALYEEHAAPLLAFVQRLMGGDRSLAEDIVQETLLRAGGTPTSCPPTGFDPGCSPQPGTWSSTRTGRDRP